MTRVAGSDRRCVHSALLFVHETERELVIYDGAERIELLTIPKAADGRVDAEGYSRALRVHINIAAPPGTGPRVVDAINLAPGGCQYRMVPYQADPLQSTRLR